MSNTTNTLISFFLLLLTVFLFSCDNGDPEPPKNLDRNECCRTPPLVGCIGGAKVFVPNAFTPNGDGNNDKLRPYYANAIKEIIFFKVEDLEGNNLYQINNVEYAINPSYGWDGTHSDGIIRDGVYNFQVSVQNIRNETMEYSGKVCCRSELPRNCIDLENHCIYGTQWDGRDGFLYEIFPDEPECQ